MKAVCHLVQRDVRLEAGIDPCVIKMTIVCRGPHCNALSRSIITRLYFPLLAATRCDRGQGEEGVRGVIFNGVCSKSNYTSINKHNIIQKDKWA